MKCTKLLHMTIENIKINSIILKSQNLNKKMYK